MEPSSSKIESENSEADIYKSAEEKIAFGEDLINSVLKFQNTDGLQKLSRKINQEVKFLKKVHRNKTLKKEHLQCSNLTHFSALIDTLKNVENCQSVNKVFMLANRKITVDIVCDNGLTWMKVIARNPKSLSQICMGNASYGVRSIADQAEEYIECAQLHPCLFQIPKVIFVFTNGIGTNLANKLESFGVTVEGDRLSGCDIIEEDDSEDEEYSETTITTSNKVSSDLSTKNISHINRVNLDVSAMLAYCCSVANGSALLYDFDVPVLKQQAEWERQRPVKPILDNFFKDKRLFCCQTAKDSFENIVSTVAGPTEKIRAKELFERVSVLPDDATYKDIKDKETDNQCDEIFNNIQFTPDKTLKVGGKIRQRSLTVFMFGDRIQAVTVTSNDGFVRAAKQQNINFVVFVHESRALTEQKEQTKAIPLVSNK